MRSAPIAAAVSICLRISASLLLSIYPDVELMLIQIKSGVKPESLIRHRIFGAAATLEPDQN
jgi:hypothetical protein